MRQRGFTLVEVLVALVIMALLAAMSWQGVDGMLRARESTQQALDRSMRLGTVVTQWEQDIAAVFETAVVPALHFDGKSLRLTRQQPDGVQVVVWSLRDGAWMRWTAPVASRREDLQQLWFRSQQLLGNEAGQLRAVEQATDWQVYFFRGNAWSNAQSTGDIVSRSIGGPVGVNPVVGDREALPTGIRFVLSTGRGTLTRDVLVPPQPQ